MSDQFCEQELNVIRAARSDKWDESLRAHAQTCPVCTEAMRVHAAMSSLINSEQIPSTPDPKLIWLKAQYAERQRRSSVITRIAAVAYATLIAVGGFGIYSLTTTSLAGLRAPSSSANLNSRLSEPVLVVFIAVLLLLLFSPTIKKSR